MIERELAGRLRTAGGDERRELYGVVYDELFRRVPRHPQLIRKADPGARAEAVGLQLRLLGHFLRPGMTFLEIGAGDCSLAAEIAGRVGRVYALDVSAEILRDASVPENVEVVVSDGSTVPVPEGSIDLAYSNQLMEHLHPDDAREQLAGIFAALAPGGRYVCVTPNRLSGPHDISGLFGDETATGFHLREYTTSELAALFAEVGFSHVEALVLFRSVLVTLRVPPVRALERALVAVPRPLRLRAARALPIRKLLSGQVLAVK